MHDTKSTRGPIMYKVISIELFNATVEVFIGDAEDKPESFGILPKDIGEYDAVTFNNVEGDGTIYIYAEEPELGLVVHECVHAANYILNFIGCKAVRSDDEVLAYLTEHLFNQIFEGIQCDL